MANRAIEFLEDRAAGVRRSMVATQSRMDTLKSELAVETQMFEEDAQKIEDIEAALKILKSHEEDHEQT